jgi:8-oxo-dGTP pyrophosphatase MutT (NUDIX family)
MAQENPVPALPSATVVVVREGDPYPELLMIKRRAGDAFGDSYAFPGGVVDHDESDAHGRIDGRTAGEANAVLGVSADGLDFYSAAIREVFEESGILLARNDEGQWATVTPELEKLRVEVDKGRLRWSEFLEREELRLACDALHYFAHWETPLVSPKRWSTRFFLAELPEGQEPRHDDSEVTDIRWLSAAKALAAERDHLLKLPFPTRRNLRNMEAFETVEELFAWADARAEQEIIKLRPVRITKDGKSKWAVRGDEGYPPAGDGEP